VTRLGVLGGTFDPVHIGHLLLAEASREGADLDRVVFVPAGFQWRKAGREITPGGQRCEMVRLAIEDNSAFSLSTLEIEREGPSYSEVTLAALAAENPGAELFFILGADALADLPNWHAPQRILDLATLVVASRPGEDGSAAPLAALGDLQPRIVWINMPAMAVSATAIRDRVRAGRSIRYLVPDSVREYIDENGLYRIRSA
jgi:nicotinate-nucleotide adenylyltransferase